ncbi:endonuclease/exonuclease/phosphatase family protein [Azospirillum picis]|uniref:Endonuclease/exonuclease/phosphatase family metal-dependent hydrolase n=1 Tax=Azospirillum picis TaxID=488438 RepID=A0ABU0MDW4_9PROT|nr:endonuclease/exonuclease/phosphatase family protein [Azospirillum picis]MBP2297347.1 endonuclease/exonuclease/phosphatase family metal-dependent hydrolase [Azospirillum picis]MDQ0531630.1 endonuclease/exonuclease/phosphatase family metal-dependent hydrolase [Azospirillum picis]
MADLQFRIATFNLENLDDDADDLPFEERIATLRPQLERLEADILCLQEVDAQHPVKSEPRILRALGRLLEGTRYQGWHVTAGDAQSPADRHNPVIVSRWPVRSARLLRHDLVPPPRVRFATAAPPEEQETEVAWDRPVLHAEIELPGARTLHVFDLHLRAPIAAPVPGQKAGAQVWKTAAGWAEGFYLASIKRAGQALETRMAVDRLFDEDPDALIVVAGDCNADLEQTAVRIIRAAPDFTGNPELADRVLEPLEQAIAEERRYTVLHAGTPVLLDHLLASPRLAAAARDVAIHNEELTDEVFHPDVPSPVSYHAPVVAGFLLPGE